MKNTNQEQKNIGTYIANHKKVIYYVLGTILVVAIVLVSIYGCEKKDTGTAKDNITQNELDIRESETGDNKENGDNSKEDNEVETPVPSSGEDATAKPSDNASEEQSETDNTDTNGNGSSGANQSSPAPSQPANQGSSQPQTPAHTHSWIVNTSPVLVKAAWDE